MTSSLVGSEMCIRDRFRAVSCWRRAAGTGGGRSPPPIGTKSGTEQGGGTVSYTHLTLPTICSV
eukprot:35071-Prorocentrum_lima.AAC.1